MNQCKRCNSNSLTYITDYEHLDNNAEALILDNGWICDECGCFHVDNEIETTWEWICKPISYVVNYNQIMG